MGATCGTCAKDSNMETDFAETPRSSVHRNKPVSHSYSPSKPDLKHQRQQEAHPLIENDGNNQADAVKEKTELLIPQEADREPSVPSSVSPSFNSTDRQVIDDVIQQAEQIKSDDDLSEIDNVDVAVETPQLAQPEYSHNDDTRSTQSNEPTSLLEESKDTDDAKSPPDISSEPENAASNAQNIDDDEKVSKPPAAKQETYDLEKYALPSELGGVPIESTVKMTKEDQEFATKLQTHYAAKLAKHPLEKMHFVHRYVVGYRHIKKKKRWQEMSNDIDYFFAMHEQFDVDHIINTQSTEQELDTWKQFIYGQDRCGHPIMYDLVGSGDADKMKQVFMDDSRPFGEGASQHVLRFMRKVENCKVQMSNKYGVMIHKQIQVMDMQGFTSDHLSKDNRKITQAIISMLTRMFPEGTYKMYIINAPFPFRAAWKIVKGFLDPITAAKTKVLGKDYLKAMLEEIDIEQIPPSYGGKGVWEIQYGSVPKFYPPDIDGMHGLD